MRKGNPKPRAKARMDSLAKPKAKVNNRAMSKVEDLGKEAIGKEAIGTRITVTEPTLDRQMTRQNETRKEALLLEHNGQVMA